MMIRYFAWIKDLTNKDQEEINENIPKTIEELKLILIKSYPNLEKHIKSNVIRYAVNMEYISNNQDLTSNDEIALFPPVSGG